MAQAFVSTYKNHFRCHSQPKTLPILPDTLGNKLELQGDVWLLDPTSTIDEELMDISRVKDAVRKLYLKRMKSTYQASYCENPNISKTKRDEKSSPHNEQNFENQLLEYCTILYDEKHSKILPPLSSSRRVFGYLRPSRFYTPLTMYQNEYGRVAYNNLRSGYEQKRQNN